MSELKPGWADATAKAVASKDEKTRCEALGLKPRRCFRVDMSSTAQSRRRGSMRGGQRKQLPPLFAEDAEGES